MEKFKSDFQDYVSILARLQEALELELLNDVIVDAVIKRYELTYYFAIKSLKDIFEYSGYDVELFGANEILKLAYEDNVIQDESLWLEMVKDKNSVRDSYSYEDSMIRYNNIKNKYVKLFENLKERLEKLS